MERRRRYARLVPVPAHAWPPFDRERWLAALAPVSLLDYPESPANWSGKHRRICESGYGRFLRWLDERQSEDLAQPPSRRFDRAVVVSYVQCLRALEYTPHTVSKFVDGVYYVTRAIEPEGKWRWLREVRNAVRRAALVPVSPDRPTPTARTLWRLGLQLMADAPRASARCSIQHSVQYRDGLMIAMLSVCPCRLQNFASLRLGVHLTRRSKRYRVILEAQETKTRRPYEAPVPPELTKALDDYLSVHRPKLLGLPGGAPYATGDHLWVSMTRRPLQDYGVRYQLALRTKNALGVAVTPHRFRHAAATLIISKDPANSLMAAAVLGHSRGDTARRHYEIQSTLHASRIHARMIEALRR